MKTRIKTNDINPIVGILASAKSAQSISMTIMGMITILTKGGR
jgi:hypothetical protein